MRVAIVGLGPAGLRTMMLLEQAGVRCEGFEARDRVGGRLRTCELPDGTFFEAGGEWIDGDHERLIALVTELQGEPVVADQYPGWSFIQGQKFSEDDFGPTINADLARVEDEADRLALDLDEVAWMNALYAEWDDQTLGSFLDRHCQTKPGRLAIEGIMRSDEGEDTDQVGLLGWLYARSQMLSRQGGEMSAMRFPQGAQRFCEAMLAKIAGPTAFNCPLLSLTEEADGIRLGLTSGDRVFDRVVLAVPPSALKHVRFEPGISENKADAIAEARMSRTVKVALHFQRRVWLEHGLKGRMMSDGYLQQVWDGGRGESAVMMAYLNGSQVIELQQMGETLATERLIAELDELLPGAKAAFLRAEWFDWLGEPYSGGGFFSLSPGYVLGHWEALIRPEGRVHFAGEHTARWTGFIEGALESAERVVSEIRYAGHLSQL